MFEGLTQENFVCLRKICSDCGCEFTIEIHKTTDGFGIQGGALYDEDGIIVAKCVGCYNKSE
jgi:hypothetical protein